MNELIHRFRDAVATYPEQADGDDQVHVIGTLCSYTPEEIFQVEGLRAYRMRAPDCNGTDLADTYMGRVTCSYTRCILEVIEDDRYEFLDGYVFAAGCDHMRRLHDNLNYLRSPQNVYMLDLPHKYSDRAVSWYAEELRLLATSLQKAFGVDLTEEAIAASIRRSNKNRKLMCALDNLREREKPPLTGSQMVAVSSGYLSLPQKQAGTSLEELLAEARNAPGRDGHRARLLLVSSQIDDPRYVEALEATGGLIVGEIACSAASAFNGLVDENKPPFEALADRYLKRIPCPRMMEMHSELLARIVQLYKSRQVDGIVLVVLKFCDTWGVIGTLFVRELREMGIPILRLEREYF
ncbi:MAG: 2-hydroxyacyl-CoA dehydratase, partial [Deltaproteobacteria bacterium]|nr:2-hydroxyacyl-CoA dehydratase [Deltaproteobacteria bacterium]